MASREKDGIRRAEGKKGVTWQAKANAAGNKPVYKHSNQEQMLNAGKRQ